MFFPCVPLLATSRVAYVFILVFCLYCSKKIPNARDVRFRRGRESAVNNYRPFATFPGEQPKRKFCFENFSDREFRRRFRFVRSSYDCCGTSTRFRCGPGSAGLLERTASKGTTIFGRNKRARRVSPTVPRPVEEISVSVRISIKKKKKRFNLLSFGNLSSFGVTVNFEYRRE